jgi:hypothetical protein
VFVGWGLDIPEKGYNDLQGLDLKGKVAVFLNRFPAEVPGPLGSHYSSLKERWSALKKAGAIGIISISNPHSMDIPWERIKVLRTQVGMTPADETLDYTAGMQLFVAFNPASADKLFAGSGIRFKKYRTSRKPANLFRGFLSKSKFVHAARWSCNTSNHLTSLLNLKAAIPS